MQGRGEAVSHHGSHLGEEISALVDGELSHDARERALGHLAGCVECRTAVDGERRTKALVAGMEPPVLPEELADRLRLVPAALSAPYGQRAAAWLADHRPGRSRSLRNPTGARRPADTRPARRPGRRRRVSAAASGAVVVGAAVAAFVVGGGPAEGQPVAPQVDKYTVEHAAVTPEVPLTDQGGPAVTVSFPLPAAP
jgi:anti-sigma factor RsiW